MKLVKLYDLHKYGKFPKYQDVHCLDINLEDNKLEDKIVIFVSHRWACQECPDPSNTTYIRFMNSIPELISKIDDPREETITLNLEDDNEFCTYQMLLDNSLTCTVEIKDDRKVDQDLSKYSEILIFFDWMFLPQKPRTSNEGIIFKRDLAMLNKFIELCVTIYFTYDDYYSRTWCVMEYLLSDRCLNSTEMMSSIDCPKLKQLTRQSKGDVTWFVKFNRLLILNIMLFQRTIATNKADYQIILTIFFEYSKSTFITLKDEQTEFTFESPTIYLSAPTGDYQKIFKYCWVESLVLNIIDPTDDFLCKYLDYQSYDHLSLAMELSDKKDLFKSQLMNKYTTYSIEPCVMKYNFKF